MSPNPHRRRVIPFARGVLGLTATELGGCGKGSVISALPPGRGEWASETLTAPGPRRMCLAGLGLGAGELGGDALGLLQDRVEVLCLDELVGLQMLKGPGAAHRQAGGGRRPGIGKAHGEDTVVLR